MVAYIIEGVLGSMTRSVIDEICDRPPRLGGVGAPIQSYARHRVDEFASAGSTASLKG